MQQTTETLQSRLSETSLLLEKFRTGIATERDREEATRILNERHQDDKWIESHQLFPLACLLIEGCGGVLQGTQGTSRRHYLYVRQGWLRREYSLIVDIDNTGSVLISAWKFRSPGVKEAVGKYAVAEWNQVKTLRGLIQWLQTI